MLSAAPYIVMLWDQYAECHCTKCRYAECRYAECRYAECCYAECPRTFSQVALI